MGLNLDILSRNLKLLRTANGMSQEELADKIYLTRSTYSTYESGANPLIFRPWTLSRRSTISASKASSITTCPKA